VLGSEWRKTEEAEKQNTNSRDEKLWLRNRMKTEEGMNKEGRETE